jgi:hypothetical protein
LSAVAIPEAPALLPADTYPARHRVWWEQCDVLLRQAALVNGAAQAAAQQATAAAMNRHADTQAAMAQAMAGDRLPTRAELVFEMVKDQPQATVLTPAVVVKGAADIVDAYVARYPGAVQP